VSNLLCNNRGISLVEVVIALFLTTVAVLAVLSLQPTAWKTTTRSDYLGRAAGIMQKELETREVFISNCCNTVTEGTFTSNALVSGAATAQPGDATITVTTTVTNIFANAQWRVDVQVTWSGNNTGIKESLLVTRQERFSGNCPC
jgi:Tfp pilus assembly protein PilV